VIDKNATLKVNIITKSDEEPTLHRNTHLFAFEGWQGSKPPQVRGWLCALCALGCKKCDRKKQQKGWLRGSLKKDRASPERFILSEGRGFF